MKLSTAPIKKPMLLVIALACLIPAVPAAAQSPSRSQSLAARRRHRSI